MSNNEFTTFFVILGLINLSIGLDNNEKNNKQEQNGIDNKLNKILELLDGE